MNQPNYVLRGGLAIAVALGATLLLAGLAQGDRGGEGRGHDEDRHESREYGDDRREAAELYQRGEIRGLDSLLDQARLQHPGRVLEAELKDKAGRRYYEVEILGEDGEVWEMRYDAASGELIKEERDR